MAVRALLDATPLAAGHARRGIGTYVRGLTAGFRELPQERRPDLLLEALQPRVEGFEVHRVRYPAWRLPRAPSPWPATIGERAVRRIGPSVFHATCADLHPSAGVTVATCHDLIPLQMEADYLAGAGRAVERAAYRRYLRRLRQARLVIAPSRATAASIVERLAIPPERVRVIPHGVPHAPSPLGGRPDGPYVLFTGGVEPHKNAALAIEAVALCDDVLRLVVTGPWSARRGARLQELATGLGVARRVDWLGHVPAGRLVALRAGAVALLVPSLAEGFGLPVLEAMAEGVPVIASDTPALREVGGEAIRYRPAHDAAGWALEVAELATPAVRDALAAAGRARAAGFTWREAAGRTADVYAEALDDA